MYACDHTCQHISPLRSRFVRFAWKCDKVCKYVLCIAMHMRVKDYTIRSPSTIMWCKHVITIRWCDLVITIKWWSLSSDVISWSLLNDAIMWSLSGDVIMHIVPWQSCSGVGQCCTALEACELTTIILEEYRTLRHKLCQMCVGVAHADRQVKSSIFDYWRLVKKYNQWMNWLPLSTLLCMLWPNIY